MSRPPFFGLTPQLLFGLCLVVMGVLLTLDNMEVLEARPILRWWPVALVIIGTSMVVQTQVQPGARSRGRMSSRSTGWVLIIVGAWISLSRLGVLELHVWEMFWPLVFILLGGGLIWQTVKRNQRRGIVAAEEDASLIGIMSGSKRKWDLSPFRHADLTAFWGGTELDLRKAVLPRGGEAVVDVFALMGGHEIQVPEHWNVVCEIQPIMGGVDDKTDVPVESDAPRLVLKGLVVMGGVSIKH